jgi:hypothetical protein
MPDQNGHSLVTQAAECVITSVDVQPFYEGSAVVDRQIRIQMECGHGLFVAIPLQDQPPSVGSKVRCFRCRP